MNEESHLIYIVMFLLSELLYLVDTI